MQQPRKHMDIRPSRPTSVRVRRQMTRHDWLFVLATGLFLALLAIGVVWYAHRNDQRINTGRYQAVFLDDGKVFFGKLQSMNDGQFTLSHVYYTVGQQQSADAAKTSLQAGNIQVIKASDEVYGPDDSISIRADKVLFWQNLRPDSKVQQLIEKQGS